MEDRREVEHVFIWYWEISNTSLKDTKAVPARPSDNSMKVKKLEC